ncbi:hypothetical protein D3C72_86810 [compost metagenome]
MQQESSAVTTQEGTFKRAFNRVLKTLGMVGVGLTVSSAPVMAQTPMAQSVPQHWVSYAQMAGNQLEAWLSDPANDTVVRLHSWMQERLLKEGAPLPPPLVVKVWVAPDGKISRTDFASLGQAQADADLRTLLTTQSLSEPPPRDMRQPMVLQLSLSFAAKT